MALATIAFAALGLIAVLLFDRFEPRDQVRGAPGVAVPEAARLAEPSSSPPPAKPPSDEGTGGSPQSAADPSRSGQNRTTQGVDDSGRAGGHETSPPVSAAWQANTQSREQGAPSGIVPTSRPAPAAAATSPPAPNLQGGVAAATPSGPGGSKAESPKPDPAPEPTPPGEATPGASDHTPPALELLRFDPPTVEGGGVTTLTIQASDDLSGLKSFSGEIRSPNRSATLPFWSQVPPGGATTFTFALTIPPAAESGIWYVSWISITDMANNVLLRQAPSAESAPAGGTLTVTSRDSDSAAPEVRQVWFDLAAVDGGQKNAIRVDVRDEESGVASIMGACQSPSKTALIWFTCTLNAESGMWGGDVPIPKDAECGNWGVQQLAAKDRAGNTALLNAADPILARAFFQVSYRAECDSTPPTLDSFDLSPTIVSSETATEILVTATVYDAGSGAAQMTGWFLGPVEAGGQPPKTSFQCSPTADDPHAPWTCKVVVPQHAAKGTWKVGVIRLEDRAHNSREYTGADPVVANRDFEVQ